MNSVQLVLLFVLGLSTGLLAESEAQHRTRRALATSNGRPLIAYLVVRANDCESHFDLLRQLQRPSIARTTEMGGALLIGTRQSARHAVMRLHRELPSVAARPASMLERRLLWRIGYRSTPILVVLDASSGSVRFAAPAPLTVAGRVQFTRALSAATGL
jgi:hypothetical protein